MQPTIVLGAFVFLVASVSVIHGNDEDSWMHPRDRSSASQRVGTINESEKTATYWHNKARSSLTSQLEQLRVLSNARNAIMFLGDGMSIPTLAAARILLGQRGGSTGEQSELSFEKFPYTGLSKTYCVDVQTADSACTSTAYLDGVKANMATIGVTAAVVLGDCQGQNNTENHVDSIVRWAQDAGKATGVVTTARITHASPAGAYAHIADRDWECDADLPEEADPSMCPDIALQLVTGETGRNIKVLMGGGRSKFFGITDGGSRNDERDLVQEWQDDKLERGNATYVTTIDELNRVDPERTDYLFGLFADSHMEYHLEADNTPQPRLVDMTRKAIEILQKEENGYFLFVEGARIDMGHHNNWVHKALDETIELSEAVQAAVDMTSERDTLIVVTADHAHTMSVSGYPDRGNDILGIVDLDDNGFTRMTVNYANGPSYIENRNISDSEDFSDSNFEHPSAQLLSSETHGADDVAILARGPWGHLFVGVHEQNYIPHAMAFALCVGDGPTACDPEYRSGSVAASGAVAVIVAAAASVLVIWRFQ